MTRDDGTSTQAHNERCKVEKKKEKEGKKKKKKKKDEHEDARSSK